MTYPIFRGVLAAAGFSLLACAAWAMDLNEARSAGLVGEKRSGYVAAIRSTPEVQQLISDVNARRRAEYTRISQQNGQSVDVVAKLAAEQIIQKLSAGQSYEAADGSWKKR